MASFASPFSASTSKPGYGNIHVSILPPDTAVLKNVSYQYPLKLVAPDPLPPPNHSPDALDAQTTFLVHTVFLLTYGGGIVAGDTIDFSVTLESRTRLILLTQGSTKIFKTPRKELVSKQYMTAHVSPNAALVYLPDPVQPFAQAAFEQRQIYNLEDGEGSLCACDWVTSGRSARGENWDVFCYKSRNEVWSTSTGTENAGKKRLLLRDNLILDDKGQTRMTLAERMDKYSVFGTLIIRGHEFNSLSKFFVDEFEALPRIGGRTWGDAPQVELAPRELWRKSRQDREKSNGLIWSAANVRGFVLVKFASREVESSRDWLKDMIREEGSVIEMFGERAVLCLK